MVYRPPLVYPPDLKEQGVEGSVEFEVKIEANGEVSDVLVLKGHPGLAEAAEDSVRQWRYEPAKTATLTLVRVIFRANKDEDKPE